MKELYIFLLNANQWVFLLILVCTWIFIIILFPKILNSINKKLKIGTSWKTLERHIKIGNTIFKSTPAPEDKDIAYRLWIELTTRKLAQPLDRENDIIIEVYNSWYTFFGLAREILKDIPSNLLQKKAVYNIIKIIKDDILNTAMRKHLTQWQGKYRKWYGDLDEKDKKGKSPQQIQQEYPDIDLLLDSIESTNKIIIEKTDEIEKILEFPKA